MKTLSVITLLLTVSGCAAVIPEPDNASSVVYLSADTGNTLLAERVDGSTVDDGRYFKVASGRHTLELLVLTELNGDSTRSDFVKVDVDNFQPDKRYRLVLTDNTLSHDLRLLDETGTVIKDIQI
ncbi:hypothetical protein [Pseudomonas syringae]|uniref:PA0061/PA0062 family lipoprotein n=1 Tax=Pseudomonas syringae TaxID=317 RepID=UPI001CA97583|nr:hypothetical protein [Pseudomonas syringae]